MFKTKSTGEGWKDAEAAKEFFGVGRATIEKIALAADAKRKIGKRALYNIHRMNEYLEREVSG